MAYLEVCIANFFTSLKSKFTGFKYLDKELWSPSTEFDDRLSGNIVKNDILQNLETQNYIGFVWTATPPDIAELIAAPKRANQPYTSTLTGNSYTVSRKKFGFDIAVFSGDPYYLIKYMESFVVKFDRSFVYPVLYPEPFASDGLAQQQVLISPVGDLSPSYDRNLKGSLSKFSFSFTTDIPLAVLEGTNKLIGSMPDPHDPTKNIAKVYLNENIPQVYIDNLSPEFIII